MSGLEIALAAAALLIGATGTWSPCGFSMVDTLGPTGHCGGRPTTFAACATFSPGAVVGGAATFGLLAALGGLVHGAGGTAAYMVAATIAVAAAIAEARGVPIVPQIRRQLPEHWRRVMPMPVAAALYGILLGLGFTTFVLSFGVWALAGISFAVGELQAGLLMGAAFGIGRALPIALLAPVSDRQIGIRATELMAEAGLYRGFRLGDAVALLGAAGVLVSTGVAGAAQTTAVGGADPSLSEGQLAFQRADQRGVLRRGGQDIPLPGTDPSVGGPYVAVLDGAEVVLLDRRTLAPLARFAAPGVDALSVGAEWIVYRIRRDGDDMLRARRVSNPRALGPVIALDRIGFPAQLGLPDVQGDRLVYAVAKRRSNSIVQRLLPGGDRRPLLRSRTAALSNPSLLGRKLLYVRATDGRQRLMIASRSGGDVGRTVYSERPRGPILWSTALGSKRAYVTVLRDRRSDILSVVR